MSQRRLGILRFLGTNCDRDIWQAAEEVGLAPQWLWYQDTFDPSQMDAIVVPGGFSYGDYLRCGALAAKAPAMSSLHEAARKGIPVLGICNGFQILCETGLLPGALVRNESLRFVDKWSELKLENSCDSWAADKLTTVRLPVAHGEGRYVVEDDQLKAIEDEGQVWWRYVDNPNGSLGDIAGVMNAQKNVAGLMPHPERAFYSWMGSDLGRHFFETIL